MEYMSCELEAQTFYWIFFHKKRHGMVKKKAQLKIINNGYLLL